MSDFRRQPSPRIRIHGTHVAGHDRCGCRRTIDRLLRARGAREVKIVPVRRSANAVDACRISMTPSLGRAGLISG